MPKGRRRDWKKKKNRRALNPIDARKRQTTFTTKISEPDFDLPTNLWSAYRCTPRPVPAVLHTNRCRNKRKLSFHEFRVIWPRGNRQRCWMFDTRRSNVVISTCLTRATRMLTAKVRDVVWCYDSGKMFYTPPSSLTRWTSFEYDCLEYLATRDGQNGLVSEKN